MSVTKLKLLRFYARVLIHPLEVQLDAGLEVDFHSFVFCPVLSIHSLVEVLARLIFNLF
jgi:hypothetical protein